MDILEFENVLNLAIRQEAILQRDLNNSRNKLTSFKEQLDTLNKVHLVLENIEEALRGGFIEYVSSLVSWGISLVFG